MVLIKSSAKFVLNVYGQLYRKDKNKEKRGREWPILSNSCISAEMWNSLIFCTATVCHSLVHHHTQVVRISLNLQDAAIITSCIIPRSRGLMHPSNAQSKRTTECLIANNQSKRSKTHSKKGIRFGNEMGQCFPTCCFGLMHFWIAASVDLSFTSLGRSFVLI